MALIKYFAHLLNEEGQPIPGADISVYLAGSTTDARIYTDHNGSNLVDTSPQLVTNEDGYFEFWIGNPNDPNGYATTQKFKIAWDKEGIAKGYNDYVDIMATFVAVDLNDNDTTRDRTVSNYLAGLWEDHRTDDSHTVHGILEVNENSGDTVRNKLVSNALAKGWEDHKDLNYDESPHNIEQVDETSSLTSSTSADKNKLVSNEVAVGWENHKNLDYDENPHNIGLADETDTDSTKNKLVSNQQLYSLWALGSHTEELSATSLSPSGDGYYAYIEHSLDEEWPAVDVYNTSERKQIVPRDIVSVDADEILIWLDSAIDIAVKVKK